MATRRYQKFFATEDEAGTRMRLMNQASRDGTIFCLVDGPDDDYAVVDLQTAIELEVPYRWEV